MAEISDYYHELLEQRRVEAASRGMAKLPENFYVATLAFLDQLYQMLESELKVDPTSRKGEFILAQYQKVRAQARDVIEWRMGKISSIAVQAVAVGVQPENLLPEERGLFDALVRELNAFRNRMTPFLGASLVATPRSPSPSVTGAALLASPPEHPTESMGRGTQVKEVVVRVIADGLPFVVGAKDTLELHKEDLSTLPERVARILMEAKRVEPVEVTRSS